MTQEGTLKTKESLSIASSRRFKRGSIRVIEEEIETLEEIAEKSKMRSIVNKRMNRFHK